MTEIQAAAVPAAAKNVDVVVAAETGSGKTLSYLIPIWSNLLRQGSGDVADVDAGERRTGALILCPNATLCEQVARVADSLVDETTGEPLLQTHALTPETGLPFHSPDVYVTTPARAYTSMANGEGFEAAAYGKPLSQTLGIQVCALLVLGGPAAVETARVASVPLTPPCEVHASNLISHGRPLRDS